MEERRKEPRKKLMSFTPVYDAHKGMVLGYLGDLTPQGAMLIGEHPLEADSRLSLSFEVPGDGPDTNPRRMTVPARVVRCVPDETPHYFKIGMEFLKLSGEQVRLIQALLDRGGFRHPADRDE